jgi:hypothetical protein
MYKCKNCDKGLDSNKKLLSHIERCDKRSRRALSQYRKDKEYSHSVRNSKSDGYETEKTDDLDLEKLNRVIDKLRIERNSLKEHIIESDTNHLEDIKKKEYYYEDKMKEFNFELEQIYDILNKEKNNDKQHFEIEKSKLKKKYAKKITRINLENNKNIFDQVTELEDIIKNLKDNEKKSVVSFSMLQEESLFNNKSSLETNNELKQTLDDSYKKYETMKLVLRRTEKEKESITSTLTNRLEDYLIGANKIKEHNNLIMKQLENSYDKKIEVITTQLKDERTKAANFSKSYQENKKIIEEMNTRYDKNQTEYLLSHENMSQNINKQHEDHSTEKQNLIKTNKDLEIIVKRLEKEKESYDNTILNIKKQYTKDINNLKLSIDRLEKEKIIYNNTIAIIKRKHITEINSLNKVVEKMGKEKTIYDNTISNKENKNNKKMEDLKRGVIRLEKEKDDYSNMISVMNKQYTTELNNLKIVIMESDKKICEENELNEQINVQDSLINDLKKQHNNDVKSIKTFQDKILNINSKHSTDISNVKTQYNNSEKNISDENNKRFLILKSKMHEDIGIITDQFKESLTIQKLVMVSKIDKITGEKKLHEDTIKKMNESICKKNKEFKLVEEDLKESKIDFVKRINHIQGNVDKKEEQLKNIQHTLSQLKHDNNKIKEKLSKTEEDLKQTAINLDKTDGELKDNKLKFIKTINDFQEKFDKKEEHLKNVKLNYNQSNNDNNDMHERLNKKDDTIKNTKLNFVNTMKDLQEKYDKKDEQLRNTKLNFTETMQGIQEKMDEREKQLKLNFTETMQGMQTNRDKREKQLKLNFTKTMQSMQENMDTNKEIHEMNQKKIDDVKSTNRRIGDTIQELKNTKEKDEKEYNEKISKLNIIIKENEVEIRKMYGIIYILEKKLKKNNENS